MRVLPVLDLLGGQVVRGIGGRRDEYRPIQSPLADSAQPLDVAQAIATRFGCGEFYLADLDAIAGADPAWSTYGALLQHGLQLWVDAGLADLDRARALAEFTAHGQSVQSVLAGLESLAAPSQLAELLDLVGDERFVFSLDLKGGRPLVDPSSWPDPTPRGIAEVALRAGVRRMIVLDLANVGEGQGVTTLELCRMIRRNAPDVELIAGGGVRGPGDLQALARAGCQWGLVASALHDGRLTPEDLQWIAQLDVE